MPPSRPQNDHKKILLSGLVLLLLTAAWVLFGPYGALKYHRITRELHAMETENERLRTDNETLRTEIAKLVKDPAYLAKVAREQFGLIRKNEVIYEFPEKKKKRE